jgi:hypothetical protein
MAETLTAEPVEQPTPQATGATIMAEPMKESGEQGEAWDIGQEFPEGEPAAEVPAEIASPEPPAAPEFDQALLDYAAQLGYTKEDFETPAAMQKAIAAIHRSFLAQGGQGQQQPQQQFQPQQLPVQQRYQPQQRPDQQQGDVPFEFKLPKALLDKDASSFDPELIEFAGNVQGMHQHYNQRIGQLESLLVESMQAQQVQQQQRTTEELDGLFAKDADLAEVFGKGARHELDPYSPQYGERVKMAQQMAIAMDMHTRQGKPIPSTQKLYDIAKGILHSDKTKQIARQQISKQLRDAKGKYTAPPVHRTKAEQPPGAARATGAVAKFMQERGGFSHNEDVGL